jgi:hypothetical protein
MPLSEFVLALRSGTEVSGYDETSLRAIDFLLELENAKAKYCTTREGRRFHACLTLVASALLVGPDISVLAIWTGIPEAFVSIVSSRMRSAGLWTGDEKEIDEWRGTEGDFMFTLLSHADVAVGHACRGIGSDGTILYLNCG